MPTAERKRKPRAKKRAVETGAGQAAERVDELKARYAKLKTWGVAEKVPWTKNTQAELDAFFAAWDAGKRDDTYVTSATADIRRLEKEAADIDAASQVKTKFVDPGPPQSKFDIEQANASREIAATVTAATQESKAFLGAATRDAFGALREAGSVVPTWAWVLGGLALGYVVLDKASRLAVAAQALTAPSPSAGSWWQAK